VRIAKNMSAKSLKSFSRWRRSAGRHWTESVHRCNQPGSTIAGFPVLLLSALCVLLAGCAATPGLLRDIRDLIQDNTGYLDPEGADSLVVDAGLSEKAEQQVRFPVFRGMEPDEAEAQQGCRVLGF